MKTKIVVIFAVVVTMMLCTYGCFNSKNEFGSDASKLPLWFSDTGVAVKNEKNRIYHIMQDRNGWLYYCSDVEGCLSPVLDDEGRPTKDIGIDGIKVSDEGGNNGKQ